LEIKAFKTVEGSHDVDLNAKVGTTYSLTPTTTVSIIDPFEEYIAVLKSCFDFDALRKFGARPDFSILFDGMHGAGGPFAKRVLVEELGFSDVSKQLQNTCALK
jgi:phosphoglucomutase